MHEGWDGDDPAAALAELRRRLADGLALAGLNQTQLAARARLGRTTVWEALSAGRPVPSEGTVAALARALKLPVPELLELQRAATAPRVQEPGPVTMEGWPGRPIGDWDPHDLEVHPAGPRIAPGSDAPAVQALPGYVQREHDQVLADAVRDAAAGNSRMVMLVGTSSTGKTRACWEAVQPLAEKGWRLWHPFDPTPAEAALKDLHQVGPRTVVWLNEAQHYLGDRAAGERIAAAVHRLVFNPQRGPVLVLGTLWPEYARDCTGMPTPGTQDLHNRVRKLLAGRTLTVPDAFTPRDLAAAAVLAEGGDRLLGRALNRAYADGRITQDLAGAPELLNRYQNASPAAKALLEAAMDVRRLDAGLHVPQAFLIDAATGYLTDTDYDQLSDDWAEAAFAELAEQVHGKQALLRRTTPRPPQHPPTPTRAAPRASRPAGPVFRLADYLEQHGRTARQHLCPPASFWHAAHSHLTDPDDLGILAEAAVHRHRLQWAHHLRHLAAKGGSIGSLKRLARAREDAGDREGAEALFLQAADRGDTYALERVVEMRKKAGDREGVESLLLQAADRGNSDALRTLVWVREESGDREGAEALARKAADLGDARTLGHLACLREKAGDREKAEAIARIAADLGNTDDLCRVAVLREKSGDRDGAEAVARTAAGLGYTGALGWLASARKETGDQEGAELLYREAAAQGDAIALQQLVAMREAAGDREGAEALLRQAADRGNTDALDRLAWMREEAGDREGAEALARKAADLGDAKTLRHLAWMRKAAEDREGAEALFRQAADRGDGQALWQLVEMRERAGDRAGAGTLALAFQTSPHRVLFHLATMREKAGDQEGAEALLRQAADHGNTEALFGLAVLREKSGDREEAEALARAAAERGIPQGLCRLAVLREESGDREEAEALAREAAEHGDTQGLRQLVEMREKAGDRHGAQAMARPAVDQGAAWDLSLQELLTRLWPHGLDPDGTPTPPW